MTFDIQLLKFLSARGFRYAEW